MEFFKKSTFFTLIFAIYFYIFYSQVFRSDSGFPSDIIEHLKLGKEFWKGHVQTEPGLYILSKIVSLLTFASFEQGAVLTLSLAALTIALIIYFILSKHVEHPLILTAVLMLVTPIYDPFFNHLFLGQASANIYHNPTIMMVKPFAYLSVVLLMKFFQQPKLSTIYFTMATITLSVIMKPSFVMVFMPSLVIFLLLRKKHFQQWITVFLIFIPTLIILLYQFKVTFHGNTENHIALSFLGVWKQYTPSPLFSLILSIAFPLLILLFRWKECNKNNELILSWICLVIGYIQFACLSESGRAFHGNWGWGLQIMIPIVFLFSVIEWYKWIKEKQTLSSKISTVVLSLHVISGVYYLILVATGHLYY